MTTSPLTWALSVAGAAAVGALSYTQLVAPRMTSEAPSIAAATAEQKAPGPRIPSTLAVAADYRGHYIVHPSVDNYRIKMMVDTGASIVALTAADARALGIKNDASTRKMMLSTANGTVVGFRTTLREIRLGDIVVRNVEAVVLPERALTMSLLGNSFLSKLQGYEVQTGRMVLRG
ncbi:MULTISPECIES: TIGR02281 family clan AA aspartic protease [Bosea]|uniref:retropepsin-like aspartic protease family protein n=1 Tax=Bosea TaxID=85413 RepID=UPI00214FDB14|nr:MULTISPECIES: TIGR02281 family clan AA aspartic protease [Bosea]MCR4523214.1 TIGR02281 family clan AA aspartic protease [Bosea sp. 47.2.35]MDR6830206.1 aspartyl protease family protein [Bosea robiniae]MDR6895538.1 aspartyl protease family protein [Bosea sp. BE109]MDR7138934.1 aspartyl protease family protein [Bosea sp. BE168]MDR7175635.1 aspartyl protease family protein [Bosea sp. BE271]